MPTSIDIDVSDLHMNDSILAKDVTIENATIISDLEMLIVHVIPPRVEKEPVAVEEVEEEEEAAEPEVITAKEEEEEEKE
jgi:large subunit ribosomal protein L25